MTHFNGGELQDLKDRFLEDYIQTITERSKGGFYNCPYCRSGTGRNGTGAFSIYKDQNGHARAKCQSCGKNGDLLQLVQDFEHLDTFQEQAQFVLDRYGSGRKAPARPESKPAPKTKDFTAFYTAAHAALMALPEGKRKQVLRGISEEMAESFQIGYCKDWTTPTPSDPSKKQYPSERIILPATASSYAAGKIDRKAGDQSKYMWAGHIMPWNIEALKKAKQPIFITEGIINALSIKEAGGEAIALGASKSQDPFMKALEAAPPEQPLILFLDIDTNQAGQEAEKALQDRINAFCRESGVFVPFVRAADLLPEDGKAFGKYGSIAALTDTDPNDMLREDRAEFARLIGSMSEAAAARAIPAAEKAKEEALQKYKENSAKNAKARLVREILESEKKGRIPTGFSILDAVMGGGLYEGLCILGAAAGLGKTTFALQMADYMAAHGTDVLYCSLEMSSSEIVAKSISRQTQLIKEKQQSGKATAKTQTGIQDGSRYSRYNTEDLDLIKKAFREYGKIEDHIYIIEGVADFGVTQIEASIKQHIALTGCKPVVIVDYLQILAAPEQDLKRADPRVCLDKSILELKRMSRRYGLPVIAISSFNRSATSGKEGGGLAEANFKESGAIEYTADLLIGLNYATLEGKDAPANVTSETEGAKQVRSIQLAILKNRRGRKGCRLNYKFDTLHNLFYGETPANTTAEEENKMYKAFIEKAPTFLDTNGKSLEDLLTAEETEPEDLKRAAEDLEQEPWGPEEELPF